ncbi:TetR/AcrR family transcriptional regulator [Methanocella sp. MCL-LM]|uniref:TetR/AcrR family transcriptional regulator n=1 Tax=Methanocella sp. MCL-LM TaxID=3412035 RepID=UPI003C76A9C5
MSDTVREKREAIINAALKLFTERGFDNTPTALISQEAGVATGTLFRYYPTKEDLINSTYVIAKNRFAAAMAEGLEDEETLEGKMRRIWGNTIRWGLKSPRELLFLEQFMSSPYISKITEEEVMKRFVFLSDLIEEGVGEGKLRDIHRGLIFEMMFSANRAVIKKILTYRLQDQTEMLIDGSFELVWSGLSR